MYDSDFGADHTVTEYSTNDDGSLKPAYDRYHYCFDDQGNEIEMIRSYHNYYEGVDEWIYIWKDVFAYDANGNQTMCAYYQWVTSENYWIGLTKNELTYDDQGRIALELGYGWNYDQKDWRMATKTEYEYGDNGQEQKTIYTKNHESGEWLASYVSCMNEFAFEEYASYQYDEEGNQTVTQSSTFTFDPATMVATVASCYLIDEENYRWIYSNYYYSEIGAGGIGSIAHDATAKIRVENRTIILDSPAQIQVYDAAGRLCFAAFTQQAQVAAPGIYVVKTPDSVAKIAIR